MLVCEEPTTAAVQTQAPAESFLTEDSRCSTQSNSVGVIRLPQFPTLSEKHYRLFLSNNLCYVFNILKIINFFFYYNLFKLSSPFSSLIVIIQSTPIIEYSPVISNNKCSEQKFHWYSSKEFIALPWRHYTCHGVITHPMASLHLPWGHYTCHGVISHYTATD